jgi:hypothetical protein
MGRTMKRLAGLVTIAGIAACSNPTVPIADRLSGSWLWVESWGGITGQVRTPSSTGETMSLRFFEPVLLTMAGRRRVSRYTQNDTGVADQEADSPREVNTDEDG